MPHSQPVSLSLQVDNVANTGAQTIVGIDELSVEPTETIDPLDLFGVSVPVVVRRFARRCEHVPDIDPGYVFVPDITRSILCALMSNSRLLIHGLHGTGKSTHIEQVAAHLNWPCVRINLDGHVSRFDLLGKDAIEVRDGIQVTSFVEGIVPWSVERPVLLCLDEYDAGRPDVMFLFQRLLEARGRLTLLDQSRVLKPHPSFRLCATANTIGFGDATGLYHGTQPINQGQLDRWSIILRMGFPSPQQEARIVLQQIPDLEKTEYGPTVVDTMVALAQLIRNGFATGDLATFMSTRALIAWGQNMLMLRDPDEAFRVSFLNRCDASDYPTIGEFYQRCFNRELAPTDGASTGVL